MGAGLKAFRTEQGSKVPAGGERANGGDVTCDRLAHSDDAVATGTVGQNEVDGLPGSALLVEAAGGERVQPPHPPRLLLASPRSVGRAFEGREGKISEATRAVEVLGNRGRDRA